MATKKKTAKKAPKKAPKRAAAKPTAARAPAAGPKPSAGKRILDHLGITDADLAAFVPGGPLPSRAVFWCQFDTKLDLDAIAAAFDGDYAVIKRVDRKFPPGAPPGGVDVPKVVLSVPGKYVAYMLYEQDGRWQLETAFREMGTGWGSNRAVYERFKRLELARIGAKKIVELTT